MKLSIIIITRNEEEMIEDCLQSAQGLGEILVVDDESDDKTREIARKHHARVFVRPRKDFSDQRNWGLEKASGDWIFYLDADERMTRELREEIREKIERKTGEAAFLVKRRNFYLGKEMFTDKVHRLFKKEKLKGWVGEVHESPQIQGETGELDGFLVHLTHRDMFSMLTKTADWSGVEARLRSEADHPPVSWWRILRVMTGGFVNQFFRKKVWRFGTAGWIEGIFQVFSVFITYARLWEIQRKESLKKTYAKISQKIVAKTKGQ